MNNIEREKIRLRNEYINRIKFINKEIFRLEESMTNLTRSGLNKDFVDNSKEKNNKKINDFKSEIESVNLKINDLESSHMDEEILNRLNADKKINDEKLKKEIENRTQKVLEMENKKKAFSNRIDIDKKNNYEKRSLKYDIERTYQHYLRANDKLPEYMKRNLKEMPNNKGYLFNDVVFLGKKEKEKNNCEILFEKQRDGSLIIHEYFPFKTVVSKKYPNGKKEILVNKNITRIKLIKDDKIKYNF